MRILLLIFSLIFYTSIYANTNMTPEEKLKEAEKIFYMGESRYNGTPYLNPNKELGCYYFDRSAELGYIKAYLDLAKCYEVGVGKKYKKNILRAILIYKEAIKNGLHEADLDLVNLYMKHRPKESYQAIKYMKNYLLNHRDDFGHRHFYLGKIYLLGLGVEKNIHKAIDYLLSAVDLGSYRSSIFFAHILKYKIYNNGHKELALFLKDNAKMAHEIYTNLRVAHPGLMKSVLGTIDNYDLLITLFDKQGFFNKNFEINKEVMTKKIVNFLLSPKDKNKERIKRTLPVF